MPNSVALILRPPQRIPWRALRIGFLLLVLMFVSGETYLKQWEATDWVQTLPVVVYPINGDGSEAVAQYIADLDPNAFAPVERFMQDQIAQYGKRDLKPFELRIGRGLASQPPLRPQSVDILTAVQYSLRLRFWAWRNQPEVGDSVIRMYVVYHDPATAELVPDSLALHKGMLGLVYAYADPDFEAGNNFVLAHELLHTLGATDKYDPETNLPIYPDGYAQPFKSDLYPQRKAELMGGRIPLTARDADMPASLEDAIIGGLTALEIRWIR
ncbi:MAG: hypothetical protein ACFCUG_15145 [Thiotrichales bacterium]